MLTNLYSPFWQMHGVAVVGHKRKREAEDSRSSSTVATVVPRALEIGDPVPYDIPELADVQGIPLDDKDDELHTTRLTKKILKEHAWRLAVKAFKRSEVRHATAFPGTLVDLIAQYDVYIVLLIMRHGSLTSVNFDDLEGKSETRAFDPAWRADVDFAFQGGCDFPIAISATTMLSLLLVPPRTIRDYVATEGCAARVPSAFAVRGSVKTTGGSFPSAVGLEFDAKIPLALVLEDDRKLLACATKLKDDERRRRYVVVVTDGTGKSRELVLRVVLTEGSIYVSLGDSRAISVPVDERREAFLGQHYADGSNIHVCWASTKRVLSFTFRVQWSEEATPVCSLVSHYSLEIPHVQVLPVSGGFVCWNDKTLVFCAPTKSTVVLKLGSVCEATEDAPPVAVPTNWHEIRYVVCVMQSQTFVVTQSTGELWAFTRDLTGERFSARLLNLPSILYSGSLCCRVF